MLFRSPPPLRVLRGAGVFLQYRRPPAARSRDALLLLWVLIMETKRVEIPGSVLDDLCRYRGAPRCFGPCRPLLFFPHSLSATPETSAPPLPALILVPAFRPASAPFPGRLLSPTPPLFFRCSLPVSHAPCSIPPLAALRFPHFLSCSTILLSRKRSSRVCGVWGLPLPLPLLFLTLTSIDSLTLSSVHLIPQFC